MKPRDLVVTAQGARYRGLHLPCSVGRSGIGIKRGEGDGITPIGRFELCQIAYRPDRVVLNTALPSLQIGPRDIWCDDPKEPAYNSWQEGRFARYSHESLRRADPLYDMIGILDFNWPDAAPGAGSAIFLHIWRKAHHPTEGCVAFRRDHLAWIFETWEKDARVIIRG